jgi:hypothetical protein
VEVLGKEPIRARLVDDCVSLIEAQVRNKGFIIKGAYATIKAVKKSFVPEVVNALLDEWLGKLQPHYQRWQGDKSKTFGEQLVVRSSEVAEDLLAVTDQRAERTSHTTAKKAYQKMRDTAKKNVVEAIPDLARVLEKHLASAA